ncbi:MAG: oligosaccharide flippase family protein [Bacilli bacterium]|nr:oligosaccharide flippase family protein [Bacilli bacterium]
MATKVLGLIIKIIFTRIVGTTTISLYTIVMPTYSLLLTISTMAMPTTISKLISQKNDPKVLNSATILILLLNAVLIIAMFILSPFIANNLLKEPDAYPLLIAMSLTLPFASLACILKGYYYGKQKMIPHVVSNTVEQIIRLTLVITVMPILIKKSYVHAATGLIFTSFFTELASIIVFLLFMNKKDAINLAKIKYNSNDAKDILSLSVPSVASRIVGNICYFFEPIILTNVLLHSGYSGSYILTQYGAYNAYAISTLTIPSFFVTAIASALIPEVSKYIETKDYLLVKKRLKQAFIFTFLIGLSFTFIIFVFRNNLLSFLYNTTLGSDYIRILAPFFILFYFEAVFASFMQAIGKANITLKITIIGSIIKLLCIAGLSLLKIGLYSLVIAEILNIILVVFLNYLYMKLFFINLNDK